jgi:hypothetical protein
MSMGTPGRIANWEWAALAALVVVALALRLHGLERIPPIVIHDECDNLVNVYQILNHRGPGFFGLDWKPQPAANVYVLSLFMRAANSIFALRLPAVLYSVAALLPFYLLARAALRAPAALAATLLLATDVWYLHFSRAGWENVQTCLFLAAAGVCIGSAVRTGRWRSFAWAGLWSALGLYGYFSGRTVLAAVLAIGGGALLRPAIARRRLVAGLAVSALIAVVLFAPQALRIAQTPDRFFSRTGDIYVLGGANAARPPYVKAALIAKMFGGKGFELFGWRVLKRGEPVQRYLRADAGAFPRLTALLLASGLLLSLTRLRDTWQWWLLFLVPFFATQALTIGSLNGARGVIVVPILYLFVGVTLDAIWGRCAARSRGLAAAYWLAVALLSAWSVTQYFAWAQSPELLHWLEPSIAVDEFPRWRADILDWTARHDAFINLEEWRQQSLPTVPTHGSAADTD